MNRLRHRASLAAVTMLVAGCGSTVATQTTGGSGTSGSSELSTVGGNGQSVAPGTTGGSSTGSGTAPGVVSNGGTATGSGTTTAGGGGAAYGGGSTGGGTTAGNAPGVTATQVYVGLVYSTNSDAVQKAGGANGLTSGDAQADGNAIIDDINRHGGVGGRKLVPVWQPFDATSTQTIDQQYASICAHFTQDKRVFAVDGQGTASYRSCLHRAGVVQIDADLPDASDSEFDAYPTFIEMGYPKLSRIAKAQLQALAGQKYFTPWDAGRGSGPARCGVVTYDDPAYTPVVNNVLIPGLKKLGCDPGANVARITPVNTASDYGPQASAVQSAELKFNSAGVNHVVMFEGNGGLSLFFMNQAESQRYHPRYGVSSTSGTEALINAGDVQKDQAVGAVGFGWIPGVDLPPNRNPDNGPYSSDSRRHCIAVYKQHNITFPDVNAEGVALEFCATLYLLQTVLNRTPQLITPQSFVNVVDSLGTSYHPAGSLGNDFGPGRHDGASVGYYWAYFNDCQCMHYTGKPVAIPH